MKIIHYICGKLSNQLPRSMKSTYMHACIRIIVVFLIVCTLAEGYAAIDRREFNAQLQKGEENLNRHKYADAFNIYHKLASQYKSDLPVRDKLLCLEAIYGCIESAIYKVSYPDAINYLMLAEEIRESENINDGRLHLFYCDLYIVYGSQTGKIPVFKYAFEHAKSALEFFIETADWTRAEKAFGNLANIWFVLDKNSENDKIMLHAKELLEKKVPDRWQKSNKLYFLKARQSEKNNNPDVAAEYYDSILKIIPNTPDNAILRAHMQIYESMPLYMSGRASQALTCLDSAINATARFEMPNLTVIALSFYKAMLNDLGDSVKAAQYGLKAIELKDSIRTFSIADDLFSLENMHQQKELRKEVSLARYKHTVAMWILLFLGIVVITVVVFLIILGRKNRDLGKRAALLRQLLKERNEKTENSGVTHKPHRYDGSNLTDEHKEQIAADIRKVLDSPAVFSPDFSLSTLSEAVGRTQKAVSQVVNEVFDTNYSTLVNRIRIYEACRRIDSPEYSSWSVEGIAESVGYSQRNTFSSNFKKFTGMGIREYRQLSENEKKEYIRTKNNHTDA